MTDQKRDQLKADLRRLTEAGYQFLSDLLDVWTQKAEPVQIETRPAAETPGLMTVKEVAAYLGVSKSAIYAWVRDGKIMPQHAGVNLRFDLAEVEAWTRTQPKRKTRLRMVK